MQQTPSFAQSLLELDPFDHAFVDAVLRLRGIFELPSVDELKSALDELNRYYTALMQAPVSSDPADEPWLRGQSIDAAASRFAFLFTQFGVLYVSQATPRQRAALDAWWETGDLDAVNALPTSH